MYILILLKYFNSLRWFCMVKDSICLFLSRGMLKIMLWLKNK